MLKTNSCNLTALAPLLSGSATQKCWPLCGAATVAVGVWRCGRCAAAVADSPHTNHLPAQGGVQQRRCVNLASSNRIAGESRLSWAAAVCSSTSNIFKCRLGEFLSVLVVEQDFGLGFRLSADRHGYDAACRNEAREMPAIPQQPLSPACPQCVLLFNNVSFIMTF